MLAINNLNNLYSTKLVGLDTYFNEMIKLYENGKFPKVLLLNGKKGIGKFTLTMHFINYIYSKNETTPSFFLITIFNVSYISAAV